MSSQKPSVSGRMQSTAMIYFKHIVVRIACKISACDRLYSCILHTIVCKCMQIFICERTMWVYSLCRFCTLRQILSYTCEFDRGRASVGQESVAFVFEELTHINLHRKVQILRLREDQCQKQSLFAC